MGDCLARQEKRSIGREEALWVDSNSSRGKEVRKTAGGKDKVLKRVCLSNVV